MPRGYEVRIVRGGARFRLLRRNVFGMGRGRNWAREKNVAVLVMDMKSSVEGGCRPLRTQDVRVLGHWKNMPSGPNWGVVAVHFDPAIGMVVLVGVCGILGLLTRLD